MFVSIVTALSLMTASFLLIFDYLYHSRPVSSTNSIAIVVILAALIICIVITSRKFMAMRAELIYNQPGNLDEFSDIVNKHMAGTGIDHESNTVHPRSGGKGMLQLLKSYPKEQWRP